MRRLPIRAAALTRGDRVFLPDRTLARVHDVKVVRKGVLLTATNDQGDGELEMELLDHGEEIDLVSPVGVPGGCRSCSGDGVTFAASFDAQMPCSACYGTGVLASDPDDERDPAGQRHLVGGAV